MNTIFIIWGDSMTPVEYKASTSEELSAFLNGIREAADKIGFQYEAIDEADYQAKYAPTDPS